MSPFTKYKVISLVFFSETTSTGVLHCTWFNQRRPFDAQQVASFRPFLAAWFGQCATAGLRSKLRGDFNMALVQPGQPLTTMGPSSRCRKTSTSDPSTFPARHLRQHTAFVELTCVPRKAAQAWGNRGGGGVLIITHDRLLLPCRPRDPDIARMGHKEFPMLGMFSGCIEGVHCCTS